MIRTKKKNAVLTPASQPRGQSLTEPPAASGTGAVSCRRARGQSVPSALIFLEVSVISKKALINEEIKAKEVRVVSADGAQIGVLSIEKALRMAFEAGLDLVEIAPEGKPPVCKIMDFGRYRFEREKPGEGNPQKPADDRAQRTAAHLQHRPARPADQAQPRHALPHGGQQGEGDRQVPRAARWRIRNAAATCSTASRRASRSWERWKRSRCWTGAT